MKPAQTTDERVDRVLRVVKELREQMVVMQSQVAALVRDRLLDDPPNDPIGRLAKRRFRHLSQHEEDGLLSALFQHIGVANRRFVEIGCGDNGGNSGFLARECGWSGLMVDMDERLIRKTRRLFDPSTVRVIQTTVDSGNIGRLLDEHDVPDDFDLLSLDIDSTDYWILKAITDGRRPRVILAEYNSAFGPDAAVTVPDTTSFERATDGHRRHYYGASLSALCRLAEERDYRLLLTDPTGTNALFLRNDLSADLPGTTASRAFRYYLPHAIALEKLGDVIALFRKQGLALQDV